MADNLESKINSSFFRRTARNIGLYFGAIALALTAGCASQKSSSKENHPYSDDYYDFNKPTTSDLFKKEPDKPKEKVKRLPLFEVGLGLGLGNSYSFTGAKLSGILNIDRHSSCEIGIGYGFMARPMSDDLLLGKFIANGSASFYYNIMEEQALFLRVFYGVQGAETIRDEYNHIISLSEVLGGGILVGSRLTSSERIFVELSLGFSIISYPSRYERKYGCKGAIDLGIGFKFG